MTEGTTFNPVGRTDLSWRAMLALLSAIALTMTLLVPLGSPAFAGHDPVDGENSIPWDVATERIAGENRAATACEIAVDTYGENGFPTVLLARWDDYPDALAGNYLAGQEDYPILFTHTGHVTSNTAACLADNEVEDIIILGRERAVSFEVENELGEDYNVTRIGGGDRYETAAMIATQEGTDVGTHETSRTAIVATGEDFPDALVTGAISFDQEFPLLLTRQGSLPQETADALTDRDIEFVLIPGGEAAVSAEVEGEINALGIATERLAGDRRTETATVVADWAIDHYDWSADHVNLARGDVFADSLSGGPHAGSENHPILLTIDPNNLDRTAADRQHTGPWLEENACEIQSIHVLGGTEAISEEVEDEAQHHAEQCDLDTAAAEIALDPDEEVTNTVGDTFEVTATVTDDGDDPVEGAWVRFEVTGEHPQVSFDQTDSDGQAFHSYTGENEGQDEIRACVVHTFEEATAGCDEVDDDDLVTDPTTKNWVSP